MKYRIFLYLVISIFFVIYRKLYKKYFRRLWVSLKLATIIAAILAGLIPTPTEAIKSSVNNNQVYHERLLSEQEFNLFEDNAGQVILAKTDDSAPSVSTSPGEG